MKRHSQGHTWLIGSHGVGQEPRISDLQLIGKKKKLNVGGGVKMQGW